MNWFKKKPHRIRVITRKESEIRLTEWQRDQRLVSIASKTLQDPNLQLMLAVVRNEHPARTALPYGVSMDDRVVLQARAEGYEMALATLERLAVDLTIAPMPDAQFESA